jgi:hypothetical protein
MGVKMKARNVWLPKRHATYYSDPTEPTKYPDLYQEFTPVVPDSITITRDEFTALLMCERPAWFTVGDLWRDVVLELFGPLKEVK